MSFISQPLKFIPIFKEKIWGGNRLQTYLNKNVTGENIGESWEISAVNGDVSVVADGFYKGKNLQELVEMYPTEILGTVVFERFGSQFPLLFKLIDAADDLSIQVHPNDELAKKRHQSFGKTEMWYVMNAAPNSRLIIGFNEVTSPEEYVIAVENQTIESLLSQKMVQEGDVFYLETGTVHAIGSGILLAEIQQTSDITYRIYDFNRKDTEGNPRELHTELALDAINFDVTDTQKFYSRNNDTANNIIESPYFSTNFIPLTDKYSLVTNNLSFVVLMCVEGSFVLQFANGSHQIFKGESILLPAASNNYDLIGNASILEIYIS